MTRSRKNTPSLEDSPYESWRSARMACTSWICSVSLGKKTVFNVRQLCEESHDVTTWKCKQFFTRQKFQLEWDLSQVPTFWKIYDCVTVCAAAGSPLMGYARVLRQAANHQIMWRATRITPASLKLPTSATNFSSPRRQHVTPEQNWSIWKLGDNDIRQAKCFFEFLRRVSWILQATWARM